MLPRSFTKLYKQVETLVSLVVTTSPSSLDCLSLDMAATMERLDEYRTHNAQFCKRIFDFLSIMVVAQVCRHPQDIDSCGG